MDEETTENESVDPGDANTEKDNVDTNLEKKNVSTNLEKENVHINTEKKSSNVLIEKVDDEKPTDNEAIDINIEQDTNIEKVSGDINTEQEVSSAELKTAYTSNNEEDGKMVQSVMSEMSTNARNLFDDVDEDTERTQTGVTRTTFDTMASASVTDFNDSTLTRNQRCTLFNMGVHDEEFEGYITISEPTVEEEEESDDIFGYLEGFSRADQAVPAPSLVILERQANEAELYKLCEQQVQTRRKYGFLNKKLSEYFKKKKMDRVFEDVAPDFHNSLFEKYERKIEEFNDIYNEWIREKTATDNEVNDMIKLKTDQEAHLKKNLKALTIKEKEIGNILLETGAVQEKVVERLISRQKTKSGKMAVVRIAYIKQRDKVKKIEMRIKELETIGGNFHLMDFEQLRMENTIYSDKIEERDEELMRLRDRYSHAIQALAHIREKCSVMEAKIEDTTDENIRTEQTVSEIREQLNYLKIERDNNRSQTHKLKVDSGLLNYPSLLIDMESSLKIADVYRHELESIQAAYKQNRKKLKAIRYSIEQQSGKNTNVWLKKAIRISKSSYASQQSSRGDSRQLHFSDSKSKAQLDNNMAAMKTKLDKIFADKNCCPIIPRTTIIETMGKTDL